MDEILQKLLSSELLSEEAKTEISSQWAASVEAYKQTVREEVTGQVRAELAKMWATEKDTLVEKLDSFLDKQITEEVSELKTDIEHFRDLEAEYAGKLVEEKQSMAEKLAEELDELVDKMDAFFEVRLVDEFQELKEDLEVVKQNQFGRKIFEAFVSEFDNSYVDDDSLQSKLSATVAKLKDAEKQISMLEDNKAKMIRESKLEKILSPLSGNKRKQMEFILQNVETGRLEEAYSHFVGRVLKDDVVIDKSSDKTSKKTDLKESATVVVTGEELEKANKSDSAVNDKFAHLRKLAGLVSH